MGQQSFTWKVAGAAGEGIMTTGLLFSKTCARHGLYIFDYTEYPSLIRGGHNTYQVHASQKPVHTHETEIDVLIALNKDAIQLHRAEIHPNTVVIFDQEKDKIKTENYQLVAKAIDLPMVKLAKEAGGEEVMANNVALGASVFILGLDLTILDQVIADVFKNKDKETIILNQRAAQAGYHYLESKTNSLIKIAKQKRNITTMTGNEAIALGALAGGLKFYAAYPMTPSSSILHFLAEKSKEVKIVVKQAEDEISAVNMALGASFAGVRTMVGTSGGGFCYMIEALGLSGIAELPLVIVNAMRPGPAVGMPTWTEQGDLKFAVNASHGEFPRFVLAPGDAQEAFELTRKALELSEKYQTPIIILSDKYLSESRYSFIQDVTIFTNTRHGFDLKPQADQTGFYPRYQTGKTEITSRSLPGTPGGVYIANSSTHNQYGLSSEESTVRKSQVDKRFQKLSKMQLEIPQQFWEIEPDSPITLISFGSTKGAMRKAKDKLKKENISVNILNLSWLWPFPKNQVEQAIKNSKNVAVIEGNRDGQLANLIAQETGVIIKNRLNRYDGRPFNYGEIVDFVKNFNNG